MKTHTFAVLVLIFVYALGCSEERNNVITGLDRIHDFKQLFTGKTVGIVTNHTAVDSTGQHISDVFLQLEDVQIGAFFGPEHGIKGTAEAGAKLDSLSPINQIPVFSLYGQTLKPTPEMLAGIDVLVFDIQDIGARFFTYIQTMKLSMEAAAENNIEFVVLDRPNPIGGEIVEGNLVESTFTSFVGLFPIPVRHGMTVGELARMINGEGWLEEGIRADLKVIPALNWKRALWYDQTGLTFIKPSPNMPDLATATVYPGMCLLEGTNVSEGRGTTTPFLKFGAPWIDAQLLCETLNELHIRGVEFSPVHFTPSAIPGVSSNPKYKDEECHGAEILVRDRDRFSPYWSGILITNTLSEMYPDHFSWKVRHFDRLCGTSQVRESIINSSNLDQLKKWVQSDVASFEMQRRQYLLYY